MNNFDGLRMHISAKNLTKKAKTALIKMPSIPYQGGVKKETV